MPTIGRVDFLHATIDSISRQTHTDFEVLVLDNASPAACAERLRAWTVRDKRVRVLRCDPRMPMFANFNRGVREAHGAHIAFCHDDDRLLPGFVARTTAFLEANPRVAFVGSNYDVIDVHGKVTDRPRPIRQDGVWPGRDYVALLMASRDNPLTMQSICFRTASLQARGFDESLSPHFGDFVVLMRMAESQDVGHLADALVEVRWHTGQTSASMSVASGVEYRERLLENYCAEFAERWPGEGEELRHRHRSALRRSYLRAWLEAATREEAEVSLRGLARASNHHALCLALRGFERLGPLATRRRDAVDALRRVRRALRRAAG